jgi:hypothetical protein
MRYFAVKGVSDLPGPIVIFLSVGLIEWFVGYNYGWLPVVISLALMFGVIRLFISILESPELDIMQGYDRKKLEESLRRAESANEIAPQPSAEVTPTHKVAVNRERTKSGRSSKKNRAVAAIEARIEAELDQAEADRKNAERKRHEELIESFMPVNPFPNAAQANLEKIEEVLKLYSSTLD